MSGYTNRKKKKPVPGRRSFWIVVAAVAIILFVYRNMGEVPPQTESALPLPAEGEIRVCFLDVGQGDSILIQTRDNAVLIDAGEYAARKALLSYLREAGVETLDYVVATHPHSDHIGGIPVVLEQFDTRAVLMPDATANTTSFENMLKMIEQKNIPVTIPSTGDCYTAGLIELTVLAPSGDNYGNTNNDSLVLRMLYGQTAFLFTGDAEWQSEQAMINSGSDLRANILKAGHHGSNTATTDAFLDAVKPKAVVISCGRNNSYGHPHAEMLASLTQREIGVYRTDMIGTIMMATDGKVIRLYANDQTDE